jgi:poly(hydroxyalkanoate) depolymerase family esterase
MKYSLPDVMRHITRLTQGEGPIDLSTIKQRLLDGTKSMTGPKLARLFETGDHPLAGFSKPGAGAAARRSGEGSEGARFLAKTFSSQTGSRPYKLYVPSDYRGRPVPLIVMLHGCTQSPDDFAAGTRMNVAAERHNCLVAYPRQTSAANIQKCWNWFNHADQQRNGGEPSLIAGITREIMRDYAIDPRRVYVAGLSAGGAAAAIMGDAYPELYAAIGVHSGLACGAARDMQSAFTAMQRGADARARANRKRVVPAIVFHGERDTTVHPRNGDAVIAQFVSDEPLRTRVEVGKVPGGHAYSRTLHSNRDGTTVVEKWVVHGAGHAWFGGSPHGSYTDPLGPDATGEMMRFFLARTLEDGTG